MDDIGSIIRFSLEQVPERQRREVFTEVFGRGVVNLEFEPLDDRPRADFEIRPLPNVVVTSGFNSPHACRSGHDPSRENDDLALAWATRSARAYLHQRGKEVAGDGTGAFFTCSEPLIAQARDDFHYQSVRLSRSLLAQLLPNPEDRLMQPIPAMTEALRLLSNYLEILCANGGLHCSEIAHAVSLHIADLVALAIGTTRDATAVATGRGLRAARTASVKAWMRGHIADPNLSVAAVALAHGISPRYVQLLFEHEGTSFSAWLRGQRLALAYRRLANPAQAHRSIACIAFDCGFSDLSWFNRAFRHSYGETPSDVRHRNQHKTRH